ncbi:glycoside hydrolase family 43 protein [Actinoplanes awajinensis]|uniref:Alpha-L-arabinofuranosidase n=1 Tax=Actinoplanes awajinensis subsp. mycoplanecinus TaxID=135947 RepID=A0A101JLS1_9ACTN|nr:glycoside hydrolase family 43 protein [Actinoplanes awajinensis]KUL29240.1 alpha-L-arabinofuranosidase [Actinoplanes awajinensis subsp. mycoplanecinus]
MKRRSVLAAGLAGASTVLLPDAARAATYSGYAMAYFTESPSMTGANYGLHLAVSTDGLNWTPLNQNNAVATPTLGSKGLRDPFILRKQDGTFVVLATDLNGTDWSYQSQYLHVWDSADLRTFSNYRLLKVHSLATHAWAPEAYWDASRGQYAIVYSAVNGTGHNVLMVNYTSDFVTASANAVFYDPGYDAIDGSFVTAGGVNYMYYKNNSNSTLLGTKSSSLAAGSFSVYTGAITPGRGVEAPQISKSNTSDVWYMWGDTWSPNGRFFCWQTTSLAGGAWTLLNDRAYTQPLNSKHLGITPLTGTEVANLTAKWGTPAWNRIKSYNYPDRYVRHASNVGRIDAYPFDPYQDQQWTLVPGLADAAGVSFRSVNYPDRYLRHSNYAMVLNANDGTSTFAADATFYKAAGFADSGWTSFRSYNYPERYLRHSNYVLRIDPVTSSSTAAVKQDATFRIGY